MSAEHANNCLPAVIHNYFSESDSRTPKCTQIVDGVGANPSDCLQWLGPLVGWIQVVTGCQMSLYCN
jgi:hypothetical protein